MASGLLGQLPTHFFISQPAELGARGYLVECNDLYTSTEQRLLSLPCLLPFPLPSGSVNTKTTRSVNHCLNIFTLFPLFPPFLPSVCSVALASGATGWICILQQREISCCFFARFMFCRLVAFSPHGETMLNLLFIRRSSSHCL